ncbi:MAG: helix-turn-helix domain-containing protein [Deltaproteobacteria bacterium]|nr:helix-turn-helix domain-containing protein [Deltaproteobacteria bacterium]
MDQGHALRPLAQGGSQRSVAKELGVSRNTVARYLDDSVTAGVRVEQGPRRRPRYDGVRPRAEGRGPRPTGAAPVPRHRRGERCQRRRRRPHRAARWASSRGLAPARSASPTWTRWSPGTAPSLPRRPEPTPAPIR